MGKKYQFLKVIGKGSYGTVSKARCLKSGNIVAIKVFQDQADTEY